MIFTLSGQTEPLRAKIKELEQQLDQARKDLVEINNKALKAKEPLSVIENSISKLRDMFKGDEGILKEIEKHILSAFNGQDDTSIEKQEDSPVVSDVNPDEEIDIKDVIEDIQQASPEPTKDVVEDAPQEVPEPAKDVVEDAQQALPEPTKDIADDTLIVEEKVRDDKGLDEAANIQDVPVKKKRSRRSKNNLENVIDQENEINNIVSGIINDVKFTNLSQIEYYFKEIEKKHGVRKGRLIKGKFITTIKDNNGWNEYIEAYNTILPGTSLCPKGKPNDTHYYVKPIENISDNGNRPTCEVIRESNNMLINITAPGPGETYWLTDKPITPPIYIMNRINTLSKTKKPKNSKIGTSLLDLDITYSDDIDMPTESSGVPF